MTERHVANLVIRGSVTQMPAADQNAFNYCETKLRELIEEHGPMALLAIGVTANSHADAIDNFLLGEAAKGC